MTTTEMTPERFARLREIYLEAEGLDEIALDAHLAKTCGNDTHLAREVRELLAFGDPDEQPLDDLIAGVARGLTDSIDKTSIPESIGPYRIVDTLGSGGMGAVYLAERDDGHFRQKVAIKVIDRNRATPELVTRFRAERQILASLDHPHIARLFDGGETDDGVPYLVMEYVDGVSVEQYCDGHRLTLRQRLELFYQVCAAIEYAHRNLVVHRDIKPSNILVTAEGLPKLLDFGIAKLLSPASVDYTMALTAAEVRVMTPTNASPEQVRGETITTATDVYSLGVLLYQLLTGHNPYEPGGSRAYELERLICETDPSKPSTVVTRPAVEDDDRSRGPDPASISNARGALTAAHLRKELKGDLDNIVMVAMRKEPERRYATVRELADDVRNYLDHRPVRARGDSLPYRAGKFLRRNPGGVALASGAALVIAALIVTYTHRLTVERDRAALEAAKAHEVTEFMTGLFREADPRQSTGQPVAVSTMLERGAERVQNELDGQPELQASLMATIGESYHNMWELAKAREYLTSSLENAEAALSHAHPDVVRMRYVLGMTTSFLGNYAEALPLHRRNYDLLATEHGKRSAEAATELHQIAFIQSMTGDYDAAEARFVEVIDIFRSLGDDGRAGLATGLMEYGTLLGRRGRAEEQIRAQREALSLRRALYGERHPDYVTVLNNVANAYYSLGELDEAARYMQENLRLSGEIFGPDAIPHGVALMNFASLQDRLGNYGKAIDIYNEAEPIYRQGYGETHPRYAYMHENMASSLEQVGDFEGAEASYLKAREILSGRFGADHLEVAITRSRYGALLNNVGRHEEAVDELTIAAEVMADEFGEVHSRTIFARTQLGTALHGVGRDTEALAILSVSLAATDDPPDLLRHDRVRLLKAAADIHQDNGNENEAQRLLEEAIGFWEVMGPLDNPTLVFLDESYAGLLAAQGKPALAEAHLRARRDTFAAEFGDMHEHTQRLADALSAYD